MENNIKGTKGLKLKDIKEILNAEVVWADEELLELKIERAGAADLMSDILAFTKSGSLMLTGLINVQSVRTADIAEVSAIIYVRGKKPTEEAIELARARRIPLLSTKLHMYEACGLLFSKGILGNSDEK